MENQLLQKEEKLVETLIFSKFVGGWMSWMSWMVVDN
jgi:hypothetical protein